MEIRGYGCEVCWVGENECGEVEGVAVWVIVDGLIALYCSSVCGCR